MNMDTNTPKDHLQFYVTEKLPKLLPGIFEGAPDTPHFTVDQHYQPLRQPSYRV